MAVLHPPGLYNPAIYLISNGRVVKDYRPTPFVCRFFVGIFSTWRETRMAGRLQGIPGIPVCFGAIDRYAVVFQYIDGKQAREVKPGELSDLFFARLEALVKAVHDRGVVLADLRNLKNIMIGKDGSPYLVDFATAFSRGFKFNPIKAFLYWVFFQDDLLGIAKLKKRLAPHLLAEGESRKLAEGLVFQREAIVIKKVLVACGKWLVRLGLFTRKREVPKA